MSKWLQRAYAHGYSSHIVATFGHYPTNGCHMREWWQLILTPVTTLLLPIYQGLTISKWWANFAARNSWPDQNSDRRRWKIPNDCEIESADSVLCSCFSNLGSEFFQSEWNSIGKADDKKSFSSRVSKWLDLILTGHTYDVTYGQPLRYGATPCSSSQFFWRTTLCFT